jgi:hypothetical protein
VHLLAKRVRASNLHREQWVRAPRAAVRALNLAARGAPGGGWWAGSVLWFDGWSVGRIFELDDGSIDSLSYAICSIYML